MKVVVAVNKREIIDNFLVRGEVFIVGQNIDYEIEFDGLDNECVLFTAYIDDICVICKDTVSAQIILNKFKKLCADCGLFINEKKSAMIIIDKTISIFFISDSFMYD